MKDVAGTLKRIDDEIVHRKQQIAMHQVEIARLQDTRLVLVGLVEEDIATAEAARMERAGVIGHQPQPQRPMIVVRKTAEDEQPPPKAAMHQRTNGHATSEKPKKPRRAKKSASGDMRSKILAIMDDQTGMTSREIGDFLGLPRDDTARKPMSNALYQLKVKGELIRDAENRYIRPAVA
jgi:hypothetical protein